MTVNSLRWRALAWALLVVAPVGLADGKFCPYADLGISFSVPDDWNEVDASFIQQVQSKAPTVAGGNTIKCLEAYQPGAHGSEVQFPYVLVEQVSYPNGVTYAEITEKELKDMVTGATGASPESLTVLKNNGVDFEGAPSASYQLQPPGFRFSEALKTSAGDVRAECFALIGPKYSVQLCLYDFPSDWSTFQPAAQAIVGSFYMDSEHSAVFKDSSLFSGTLQSAIVGGIAGIGFYLYKRTRKARNAK